MKKLTLFIACLFALAFTACNQPAENNTAQVEDDAPALKGQSGVQDSESEANILAVALGSPDHTTLVAAVQAADMVDVLTNAGPLTVFAPTNAAFDALPEGTVDDLLKPENKATLQDIISYHAAPGSYTGRMLKGVMGIGQANMQKVVIEEVDGVYTVNGAKILGTVKASNGYVHVIDQVLLPPAEEK